MRRAGEPEGMLRSGIRGGWRPLAGASPNVLGILAMIGANGLFIVNDTFVKLASEEIPITEIVAIRGTFATAFVILMAFALGALPAARTLVQPLVLVRATLEVVIAFLFITALSLMALSDVTAILQAVPLIITALSVFFLRERVGWRRWTAIVVGFVGVLLVVQPTAGGLQAAAIFVLLSAFGVAVRDLVTRVIHAGTPSILITLSTTVALTLTGYAAAPLSGGWSAPGAWTVLGLALAALAVAVGNFLVIVAMRAGEVSVVSPFRYTVVVFAVAVGFAVWGDLPDGLATFGMALIIASGIYTMRRERKLGSAALPPSHPRVHG